MMASTKPTFVAEARRLIGPKFEAYFSFTGELRRSVPLPKGGNIYPDASMISDLNFLWLVFAEVHQLALDMDEDLAALVKSDSFLKEQFRRILEGDSAEHPDGEFWYSPNARQPVLVSRQEALNGKLKDVLRTLRNGFAHAHWLYHDLSALDYWKERGWATANAARNFKLEERPRKNYMVYIADAKQPFDRNCFWSLTKLRILITPAAALRYHLHLFLASLLTGRKIDVFGNSVTS